MAALKIPDLPIQSSADPALIELALALAAQSAVAASHEKRAELVSRALDLWQRAHKRRGWGSRSGVA